MFRLSSFRWLAVILFFLIYLPARSQQVKEPAIKNKEWSTTYQPFRIAGNLYYVGTYDLACYLITTKQGHILVNTGLASSATQLKRSIEALGFSLKDVKILLTTQAHYDHLGAMAQIKKLTAAKLMVNAKDADVVKDGGSSDYALGGNGSTFKPMQPDRLLKDGDTISIGDAQLILLHHPGHTKGSCSYLFNTNDGDKKYRVLIANMPTIVTDSSFHSLEAYTEIASDYAYTLAAMKKLQFDIWVASHASQFGLHKKHTPGDAYRPEAFADRAGYDASLQELQADYDEKMQEK